MSKQESKKSQEGLTVKKEENFSEWYSQVVQKAELADYSAVKGCMVIRPNAYSIWEILQDYFNERIKAMGVKNAYFPLFIPESFFKKEAEHAQGFSPEVAWIANREDERLAVRPTSETIMYDSYSKWIRSWRDLPLRINQWCNVVRWETKATRLFLRTREFLWQEGHCVYPAKEDCDKETLAYLKEYQKMCEEALAIPVLAGKKTEKEKFSGGFYTLSVEGIMPDGKALQMATSHNLGQGFAKSFGISYLDKNEKKNIPWQNSWGVSTRVIGAITMVHGDNKGLVLPPKLAYNKAVIIPLIFKGKEENVIKKAKEIHKKLNQFKVILDDRDYTAGWKFNEWELKGIPLRIEIGPRDVEKKQITLVRRDNSKKIEIKETNLIKDVEKILEDIQNSLFKKAKQEFENKIIEVKNISELKKAISQKKIAKTYFCGKTECEDNIKDQADGAVSLNVPFTKPSKKGKCVFCSKDAEELCYFGKSY
jgi:prolyl-tRNA synthetase